MCPEALDVLIMHMATLLQYIYIFCVVSMTSVKHVITLIALVKQ